MSYETELVYSLTIDEWVAELRFESGLEFLIAIKDGKPAIVRFTDDGVPTFTRLDEVTNAVSNLAGQIEEQNAVDASSQE